MKQMNHTKKTLSWIYTVAGDAKWLVAVLVAAESLLSLSGICYAFAIRRIINAAVDGNRRVFFLSIGALIGVLCIQLLLQGADRYLNEYTGATVENRFKSRLFSTLLSGDFGQVTAIHSGEWMNRLTSDAVVVAGGVTQILPGLIGMLVRLIGAVSAIVWLEPRFFYIVLPGGGALVLLTYVFRRTLKRFHKRIQEADGALRVYLQERLESLLIVRSFGREEQTRAQAQERMEQHKAARLKRNRFSILCNLGFGAVMNDAYLLGLGFCGYGILTGTMSYGSLMAIVQLIGQAQSPFANLTGFLPRFYAMLASAERLMEAETFPADKEPPLPQQEALEFYRKELLSVRLEQACFTYPTPDKKEGASPLPALLQDVSLEIRKGEHVVFTGPSGCGKSTVLKLLMCLYPLDSGVREITTAQGAQPLTARHRSLFAYVPQGNQLLSGPLREIIAFGDRERAADDAGMHRALSIACAEEFVSALEEGLDTLLGERGLGLSEGQLQRIAIARAIFSGSPILILDEATSALDEATARQLLGNLRSMTDQTVILVTHRADQAADFDRELIFSPQGIREAERTDGP